MTDQTWLTTSAGLNMPGIIYGTAWKKERTADLVVRAVRAGFRGIDTACQPKHYEESLVGEAIHRLAAHGIDREALYVQTKFTPLHGQDPENVPYEMNVPVESQVAQSFEKSLANLRTEYVDSLVLHSPLAPHTLMMKAWAAMEKIHEAGGARQLGISNCYDIGALAALHADSRVKPTVVQNRFYQATGYDRDLRHWCSGHGVLYQSFWTLTANPHLLASSAVRSMAREYNKTEPQILFRYLSQSGIIPLTGTCSEQHMIEDIGIFEFELTDDEVQAVDRLLFQS